MTRFLPQTKGGLWAAFFMVVVLALGFGLVMYIWDFAIIDEIWRADDIRSHVAAMSQTQRTVHAVMTATLDVAFPFAYAALLGGLACAGFPGRAWLALPIALCVPIDLIEGLAQVLILTGSDGWIAVKTIVTPIKLVLFILGVLIGVAGIIRLFFPSKVRD